MASRGKRKSVTFVENSDPDEIILSNDDKDSKDTPKQTKLTHNKTKKNTTLNKKNTTLNKKNGKKKNSKTKEPLLAPVDEKMTIKTKKHGLVKVKQGKKKSIYSLDSDSDSDSDNSDNFSSNSSSNSNFSGSDSFSSSTLDDDNLLINEEKLPVMKDISEEALLKSDYVRYGMIKPLTTDNIEELEQILKDKDQGVILFYSPTCPHCIDFFPVFADFAIKRWNQVHFIGTLDANKHSRIADLLKIPHLPWVAFLKGGKLSKHFIDLQDIQDSHALMLLYKAYFKQHPPPQEKDLKKRMHSVVKQDSDSEKDIEKETGEKGNKTDSSSTPSTSTSTLTSFSDDEESN